MNMRESKKRARVHGDGEFRLSIAQEWIAAGGSALLYGSPGSGQSVALAALSDAVLGSRVLRCSGSIDGSAEPYSGLAEILSDISTEEVQTLLSPRRPAPLLPPSTLDEDSPLSYEDWRIVTAVQLATINLIRMLARNTPVLILVDNVQLLDSQSRDVLMLIAGAVDDVEVQVAVAETVTSGLLPTGHVICPGPRLIQRYDAVRASALGVRCQVRWPHHAKRRS